MPSDIIEPNSSPFASIYGDCLPFVVEFIAKSIIFAKNKIDNPL